MDVGRDGRVKLIKAQVALVDRLMTYLRDRAAQPDHGLGTTAPGRPHPAGDGFRRSTR